MLDHGGCVGAGHIGDGNAGFSRRFKINGVDPDTNLLNELQFWSHGNHLCCHRFQAMQKHISINDFTGEAFFILFIDNDDIQPFNRGKTVPQPITGGKLQ